MNGGGACGGGAWAVWLPARWALSAAALRRWPDVRVCPLDDGLWLRGPDLSDRLDLELRKLPGGEQFTIGADGKTLTQRGRRIPAGTMPQTGWQSIATWFVLAPQPAALAGDVSAKLALRLVRADVEEPASMLVTTLAAWSAYATTAPLVRLRQLRFAVSEDGRALIRGTPPPPIPGRRYVERDGIAIPCGFTLSPSIDAASVRSLIGTNAEDLALFDEQARWERIGAEDFVAATRAAVRATVEAGSDLHPCDTGF